MNKVDKTYHNEVHNVKILVIRVTEGKKTTKKNLIND